MSTSDLERIFRRHQSGNSEQYVDLWHVYDDLSRTPYQHGSGIQCEDPDVYLMNPWHVITPLAVRQHLDWRNRIATQFVSFYGDHAAALVEQQRRIDRPYVPGGQRRDTSTVRVAHVRLPRNTKVWAFSRLELLDMMAAFGGNARCDTFLTTAPSEWFVWGAIPDDLVLNRHNL